MPSAGAATLGSPGSGTCGGPPWTSPAGAKLRVELS